MTGKNLTTDEITSHLVRMRVTTGAFLATVAVAAVLCFVLPQREGAASPRMVSLVAAAAALWIGFSANRDAERRLDKVRRAAAVHGDERRLLRDHWWVYAAILVRLEVMVIGGVVVALWGLGPTVGVWIVLLGGVMMALSWPTMRKTQLLLGRVRALREGDEGEAR